jgi:urea transporter
MGHTFQMKRVFRLISISLKGFSQVMLMENALSGGLILLGIFLHSPLLATMAFLSSMAGTLTGYYLGGDRAAVKSGLYGFNSLLSGIAVMLFLYVSWRWMVVPFVGCAAGLLMIHFSKVFNKWHIPVLTIPFVLMTWIGLLLTYRIDGLHVNPSFVTASPTQWLIPYEGTPNFFVSLIKGVGEVFIIDSFWAGSLILLALFAAGWRYGVYAIAGAFISWLTAISLGVDVASLDLGLYNYNAVLTIIAVGLLFDEKRNFPFVGILAAAMTVPITAGMDHLINPIGLPALTSPFIISTWIFLVVRKFLPI